jgi:dTDP-4-amino-4,6-dideoxygalactose transaminase
MISKRQISDLAIMGGRPTFDHILHVGAPSQPDRQRLFGYLNRVLDSGRFTNHGPLVAALEKRLADFLGVRHCVAVCNGTIGLELAVWSLGLTGEVVAPSFTFVATIHALHRSGLKPVFCDIDPHTHNLDPVCVEAAITPTTSGIVGVHVWGRPCATAELTRCAQSHGLRLMFDAAHAFACSSQGRMIGSFGSLEVFSFHATKFLHTMEGGAIALDDEALADELRRLRNFGFSGVDRVASAGTNAKMHEFSAAVGLTLLDQLDELLHVNRERHEQHQRALAGIPGLSLITYGPTGHSNYQYLAMEVDEGEAGVDRDTLMDVLWAENVHARRYFWPGCHRMAPYATLYPEAGSSLPHTERLARRILCLPTGAALSASDVEKLGDLIRFVIVHGAEVRQAANY